ncbi:MAG: helix-turn-helix transcriptional regulator [Bacteroidota bacterium]
MLRRIKDSSLKKEYSERINNRLTTDWKFALKIFQMELTEQILTELEKRNLSRSDLAAVLGVSRSYISQLLNGRVNLRSNTYFRLCFEIGLVPNINYSCMDNLLFEKPKICKIVENLSISSKSIETKAMSQYEKVT